MKSQEQIPSAMACNLVLVPGLSSPITYLGQTENYSYGAQLGGVLRIGDNDQGYTLGNQVDATVWGARKITDSLECFGKNRPYLPKKMWKDPIREAFKYAKKYDTCQRPCPSRTRSYLRWTRAKLLLSIRFFLKGHRYGVGNSDSSKSEWCATRT